MLNEKQFIEEQKDCADMLGMSLEEYQEYIKNIKVSSKRNGCDKEYDNTILKDLGLLEKDLKYLC